VKLRRGDVELHHEPPLALRPVNEAGTDYIPPQHSKPHLLAVTVKCHRWWTAFYAPQIAKTKRRVKITQGERGKKRRGRKLQSGPMSKGFKKKWAKRPFPKRRKDNNGTQE